MQTTSNSSSLGLLAGNPWLREVQVIDLAVGELERSSGRRALSLVLGERLLAIGLALAIQTQRPRNSPRPLPRRGEEEEIVPAAAPVARS